MTFQSLLALLASAVVVVKAQNGIAQCNSSTGFDWTVNGLGQSPCYVGSKLGGVCNNGEFTIAPLDEGLVYIGPTADIATDCRCSTVFYSMLSACAACQGRDWLQWTAYNANCSTVYEKNFPHDVPTNTNIPGWAYLDVVAENQWNDTTSESFEESNPAETSGVAQSTSTEGASTSTESSLGTSGSATASQASPSVSSTSGADDSNADSGSGKKSNAGAIAGGVVGGVVGLALIGALIWFLLRRKNQSKGNYGAAAQASPSAPGSPQMANYHQPMYGGVPAQGNEYGNPGQQKLYDPADPSTFPTGPGVSYGQGHDGSTTYSGPTAVDNRTSYAPQQGPPRAAYSGAAEI